MLIFGMRSVRRTIATGIFACGKCGVDRPYRLLRIRRFFHIFFIPLLPMGASSEVVQCDVCRSSWTPSVLDAPTADQLGTRLQRVVQLAATVAIGFRSTGRDPRAAAARSVLGQRGWTSEQIDASVSWARSADESEVVPLADELWMAAHELSASLDQRGIEHLISSFGWILAAEGGLDGAGTELVRRFAAAAGLTAVHTEGLVADIVRTATGAV